MERDGGLLAWQLALYPRNHRNRLNLVLHVLTVPLFWAGTIALAFAWRAPWLAAVGPVAMILAVVAQGRGHAREIEPPVPFAGPADVAARIFVEQWITFPRWVLRGGLAEAWRAR